MKIQFSELNEQKQSFWQNAISLICVMLAALFIATFVTNYVVTRVIVKGDSMKNTLHDGDIVWVYMTNNIKCGDVVIFPYDIDGKPDTLVKRVIAIEGETVYTQSNNVCVKDVNGTIRTVHTGFYDTIMPTIIPKGHFYAMGDNIAISYDSTEFGAVDITLIIGKVIL